ncbi:MAG: LamG domain-containing protein [Phycisphaerales bacterium]
MRHVSFLVRPNIAGIVSMALGCLTMILGSASALAQVSPPGVTFYASFDQSLTPDRATGAAKVEGNYQSAPGRIGRAWYNDGRAAVYLPDGNFTRDRGMLVFWFKADPELLKKEEPKPGMQSLFSASNFALSVNPTQGRAFFMTGDRLEGEDFQWDYSRTFPAGKIVNDQWTHIALTWDRKSGRTQVFINGQLLVEGVTRHLAGGSGGTTIRIGNNAPGLYDELTIWDRVLNAEAIAKLATDTRSILSRDAQALSSNGWPLSVPLVYRPVTNAIVSPGEPFKFDLPVTNTTDQPLVGQLVLTLLDLWEQPVGEPMTFDLSLPPRGAQSLAVMFPVDRTGAYKVAAEVRIGTKIWTRDVASFGCLPAGNPPEHPFFGAHVGGEAGMPEAGRRLGFTWNRVHNMTQFTWWARMQPEPNLWEMRGDKPYESYMKLGYHHLGQWFAPPYWVAQSSDGAPPSRTDGYPPGWKPVDAQALKTYVDESLRRFPDIEAWEIWNEPWVSMFWNGSVEDYVNLCRTAYTEAKRVRPDVTVYAAMTYEGPWARRAIEAGVLNYCDGLSFHRYLGSDSHPQQMARDVAMLRKLVKTRTDRDIPIIHSEGGVSGSTFLRGTAIAEIAPEINQRPFTFREAACEMVQSRVVMLAADVKQTYYYMHSQTVLSRSKLQTVPGYSSFEVTGGPKPMMIAHAILVWQMDGGAFDQELALGTGVRAYLFNRKDGGSLAVLWAEDGVEAQLDTKLEALDLMGNPITTRPLRITNEPIYLRHAGNAVDLAGRLKPTDIQLLRQATPQVDGGVLNAPGPDKPFALVDELGKDQLIPIDMSPVVNRAMADEKAGDGQGGWTDEGPFNDMRMLSPGRHIWLGVPFELAGGKTNGPGVLAMAGRTFPTGPTESQPIPVKFPHRVRGLFFAHSGNWIGRNDETIAEYRIRYADGTREAIPVVTGQNIADWWNPGVKGEESRPLGFLHPDPGEPSSPYRFIRLWYWPNPHPDRLIESITVVKKAPNPGFILLGITAAVW